MFKLLLAKADSTANKGKTNEGITLNSGYIDYNIPTFLVSMKSSPSDDDDDDYGLLKVLLASKLGSKN